MCSPFFDVGKACRGPRRVLWFILADSLKYIRVFSMQYPSRVVEVPDIDSVNPETVKALVEFHEY